MAVEIASAIPEPCSDGAIGRWVSRSNRDVALRRLLALGDAIAVASALGLAAAAGGRHLTDRLPWGLASIPMLIVLFKLYGLYDSDVKRISHSTVDDVPRIFHAAVIGGLLLWLYSKWTPLHRLDFMEVLVFGLGVMLVVPLMRVVVRNLASALIGFERALLVGSGELARTLLDKLAAHPEYGLVVVGSLMSSDPGNMTDQLGVPVLGTLDALDAVAAQEKVGRVLFASTEIGETELEGLLRRCRALSLKVSLLPGLSDVLGPAVEIDDVEGVTVLGVNPPWLPRSSRTLKRIMDLALAAVLLLLLSPFIAVLALVIQVDSPGGAIFAQERVGRAGRRFRLYKFRTMVVDAEQRRAELLAHSSDPDWLLLDHDPRITRVGRWIRRLSLDELPQLWNVLCGQMSMVGPRPLIPAEDERVHGWARGRLDLTPGITGYWQVLGRTRIPFEEMVKLDYLYVMNWSLWEDVRLMLRTLPAVLGGRGAN